MDTTSGRIMGSGTNQIACLSAKDGAGLWREDVPLARAGLAARRVIWEKGQRHSTVHDGLLYYGEHRDGMRVLGICDPRTGEDKVLYVESVAMPFRGTDRKTAGPQGQAKGAEGSGSASPGALSPDDVKVVLEGE